MPNGSVRTMRYNKETPITDRMALVEKYILDYWGDFFQENWLNDTGKALINDTKNILDRCATFILLADMRKNNILSKYKINSINQHEIQSPYEDDADNEDIVESDKENKSEEIVYTHSEFNNKEKKRSKQIKKWRQSKTRKLHKLYTLPDLVTYRIKPISRYEVVVNGEKQIVDDGKTIRNAYRQAILDAEYITIGNQKGIIDKSKPYTSEWCLVDTSNTFTFGGRLYQIDNKVKQYKVQADNKSEMDKILCILVDGELIFFDQNIDAINNKSVKQVQST
jgi:hypothetical protein